MKIIILMILCFWNLTSQAASEGYELHSQNKNHDFMMLKDNKTSTVKESLAFNGWYSLQLKPNMGNGYSYCPFYSNGDANSTATKFLLFDAHGVEALFVKVDGKLVETQDAELLKSTLKEMISSRKKELETHIGEGEPEVYMSEAGSCSASQAAEAALLKKKVPHVVLRTGLTNVSYATVVKNAESFNCLSESEFINWANKKVAVKPSSCGKENAYTSQVELRQILDAIAAIRGRKISSAVSPVDFTQEMSGNW